MRLSRDSRIQIVAITAIALVAFFAARAYLVEPEPATGATDPIVRPLGANDHILGDPSAPIQVFVYTDLECPYCKSYHQRTIPMLQREYGDDIAFIFRHYPLPSRPKAYPEALAAECASLVGFAGLFWPYIDRIYAITPSGNGLDLALLDAVAVELGIDAARFASCRAGKAAEGRVQLDMLDGAAAGVRITPSSVIVHESGRSVLVAGDYPSRLRAAINLLHRPQ